MNDLFKSQYKFDKLPPDTRALIKLQEAREDLWRNIYKATIIIREMQNEKISN